jgi:hypothetical protein
VERTKIWSWFPNQRTTVDWKELNMLYVQYVQLKRQGIFIRDKLILLSVEKVISGCELHGA